MRDDCSGIPETPTNTDSFSERKFRQAVRLFSADLFASEIARLTGLDRDAISRYPTKFSSVWLNIDNINLPFPERLKVTYHSLVRLVSKEKEGMVRSLKQSSSPCSEKRQYNGWKKLFLNLITHHF